jgi:ABC-type cobalamin/Fe3+-siderophores transport system ATPase subunit
MNRSQQRLKSIKIHYLKSINDLTISFEDKNVTAILGPNGNGKSTILHSIACVYKPQAIV